MDGLTCLERYKFWMLIRKGVENYDYVLSLKLISIISKRRNFAHAFIAFAYHISYGQEDIFFFKLISMI